MREDEQRRGKGAKRAGLPIADWGMQSCAFPGAIWDSVFFDVEADFGLGRLRGRRKGMKQVECRMQNSPEAPRPERNLVKARMT